MSTVTPVLNLVKPASAEQFSLATLNNNMDIIDSFVSNMDTKLPKGLVAQITTVGVSGGIATGEGVLDMVQASFVQGRWYELSYQANMKSSGTSQRMNIKLKRNTDLADVTIAGSNTTSAIYWDTSDVASQDITCDGRVRFQAQATETSMVKATAVLATGTVAATFSVRTLSVIDLGKFF